MIDNHIEQIHTSVTENVKQTIKYVRNVQKSSKNNHGKKLKSPNDGKHMVKLDSSMFAIRRLWDQVASPEESEETNNQPGSFLQMTIMERKEFKPRITKGEEEALAAKDEHIDTNFKLPSGDVILVDSQIDRFKRQNGITVNRRYYFSLLHKYFFTCSCIAITKTHMDSNLYAISQFCHLYINIIYENCSFVNVLLGWNFSICTCHLHANTHTHTQF